MELVLTRFTVFTVEHELFTLFTVEYELFTLLPETSGRTYLLWTLSHGNCTPFRHVTLKGEFGSWERGRLGI